MNDSFRPAMLSQIPKLRAYAMILTRSSQEADDLVQDALLRTWRFQEGFEAGTNLTAWMFRIMKNEFLSQRSRKRLMVEDPGGFLSNQVSCEADQEWRLRYGELLDALQLLPDDNRDALLLVVAAGLSYQQAAEVCGCDAATLKGRVYRARVRLTELTDPAERTRARVGPRLAHFAFG